MKESTTFTAKATRENSCICLTCYFKHPSATQCVVLIIEKSQKTTTHGVLNMQVLYFTRDGDRASGCLPEVNVTHHQIDVFLYQDGIITGDPTTIKHIAGKQVCIRIRINEFIFSITDLNSDPYSSSDEDGLTPREISMIPISFVITLIIIIIILFIIYFVKKRSKRSQEVYEV